MENKVTAFQKKVYEQLVKIPRGKVSTYGYLAKSIKSSPRAVGNALRCNPFAPKVPCHRIVKSDLSIGGFHGQTKGSEIERKIALLKSEGVELDKDGNVLDKNSIFAFNE